MALAMMMMVVVVVVMGVTRVEQRGTPTDMNIVVVSFDDHNVVGVL